MRAVLIVVLGCFFMAAGTRGAVASCFTTGERAQSVSLSVGGKDIEEWEVTSSEIYRTRLPNGFQLGLKVEPATAEKYGELLKTAEKYGELLKNAKQPAYDELVKISLYDMRGATPKLLTSTWGGANSKQRYGPRGGTDRIKAIGEPGIVLWLHKAVCVKAEDLARLK